MTDKNQDEGRSLAPRSNRTVDEQTGNALRESQGRHDHG